MWANREYVGPVGLYSHPQAYGIHHPWIALGASPLIPVKKLRNTISPISFLWGDISSDRQMNYLLHRILRQKNSYECPESLICCMPTYKLNWINKIQ